MKRQGLDRTKLLYHGPLQPYAAYWAVGWLTFLLLCARLTSFLQADNVHSSAGFTSFIGGFDMASFATSYVGLPVRPLAVIHESRVDTEQIALGLFLAYKFKNGSQFWRTSDMDFVSGIPTLAQTEGTTLPACSFWDRLLKKL